MLRSSVRTYYMLTKPGIIQGNLVTATGGFLLASRGHIEFGLLLALLAGTSFVIGSACVINNYLDRGLDARMTRTKNRALVKGTISTRSAWIYGAILGALGFAILAVYTNPLTVLVGLVGFVDYVVLYGITKRLSVHGTVVGSISGATPVVAGYTAVTNQLDTGALLLFLILVCWQMPHFYAIAIRRRDEYKAADLPVLPVKQGVKVAKEEILAYVVAFVIAASLLSAYGYTGYTYRIIMFLIGINWIRLSVQGFKTNDDTGWARKMFLYSLLVITIWSVLISLGAWLP